MNGVSFSGLATGLPAELVDQLIEVERAPVYRFQQRITALERTDRAWGEIVTKISGLRTATNHLLLASDYADLWTASSGDEQAIAVEIAGTPTQAGALSFTVTQLAQRQSQTVADTFAGPDAALGGRTLSIGGVDVTPADGTLRGLVEAVNADGSLGVSARAVQVSPGQYQLQLTATTSGLPGAFTVDGTGWGAPFTVVREARNAVLDVDGLTVERPSNTFDDLVEGVRITLRQPTAAPVEVGVARDGEGLAARVTAFVDALNGVLGEVARTTAVGADGAGSVLTGDVTARRIAGQLTDALLRGGGTGTTPYDIGIEITREGTFRVDESKLAAAIAGDFEAVRQLFMRPAGGAAPADGLAGRMDRALEGLEGPSGIIARARASLDGRIDDFTDRIDAFERRLVRREEALRRQFATLERLIGQMNSTSQWLSSQIASLPGPSQ